MVTTKEKPIVNTQNIIIKDSNHMVTKSHQITKTAGKESRAMNQLHSQQKTN